MFFLIQQQTWNNNVIADKVDKGFNLLMNLLLNVYLYAVRKKSRSPVVPVRKVKCIHGTIENLRRMPTKINENRAICQSQNFRRLSDIVRHLMIFRIFSNEMQILLLIIS